MVFSSQINVSLISLNGVNEGKELQVVDPVDIDSAHFVKQVSNALEHFWEVNKLGHHPLSRLKCLHRFLPVNGVIPSTLELGRAVHQLLDWAMQEVKSIDSGNHSVEARYHPILYKEYIERLKNHQVAQQFDFSESTFYRIRREALECITQIIADLERRT